MSPESTTPDAQAPKLKDIVLNEQDYLALSIADPNSDLVQSFMKDHGVSLGDTVALHVAGKENVIVATTHPDDFFTTLRHETEQAQSREVLRDKAEDDLADVALETTGPQDPEAQGEIEKNPYYAKLFAPIVRPELPPSKNEGYDYLFAPDEERNRILAEKAREMEENAPILEEQGKYDRLVNEDTRAYSQQRLKLALTRDSDLKQLLTEAGFSEATPEAVDAIRTDPDLAYKVGMHFLKKIHGQVTLYPEHFGDRVVANKQKRTDFRVLPVATNSQDYVAYLAWAKVGGFFNYKSEGQNDIEYDESGRPIRGQHRAAVDMIL